MTPSASVIKLGCFQIVLSRDVNRLARPMLSHKIGGTASSLAAVTTGNWERWNRQAHWKLRTAELSKLIGKLGTAEFGKLIGQPGTASSASLSQTVVAIGWERRNRPVIAHRMKDAVASDEV